MTQLAECSTIESSTVKGSRVKGRTAKASAVKSRTANASTVKGTPRLYNSSSRRSHGNKIENDYNGSDDSAR